MFKQIMDSIGIGLLVLAAATHIMRIIWILFQPRVLSGIRFIRQQPDKTMLIIYYVMTVVVCAYGITRRLG